jgi:hypothetical protein
MAAVILFILKAIIHQETPKNAPYWVKSKDFLRLSPAFWAF